MNRSSASKTVSILLIIVLLSISFLSVTADTILSQNYVKSYAARSNNTNSTYEYFSISSGEAVIYTSYTGYQNVTTGAQIETKVQRKFLFFWVNVDNGQTNNTWIDSFTGYQGSVMHSTGLSSTGNYRAVITYYVYGSGGDTDVIDITLYSDYE
ncbi:MAG: hypothetical protein PHW20_06585 [Clostridia bacterium]|jgi:hypothetical protein|nr:hypothetical protein [Clostridia bacterium]